jgi:Ran GTPase-activating protein (RanGAP) involved in mRNA processing and transport
MNMKRFLSDSFRRDIDASINRLLVNHKVTEGRGYINLETINDDKALKFASKGTTISAVHAAAVYQQKCIDLNLGQNAEAEKRFVEQFLGSVERKSLRFSGLGLGPRCMNCLIELFEANPQLALIDLSVNRLGDTGARIIGDFLARDPPIIYLDLRSNNIGISGAVELFDGLKNNCHLTRLDLSSVEGIDRNRIGTLGCKHLSAVIYSNNVLSHLNISMCGVTADGCLYLGEYLPSNETLTNLDLSMNRFGSPGAINLFKWGKSMANLVSLSLAKNGIGNDASAVFCKQLSEAPCLRFLDLSDNIFGDAFIKRLYLALSNGISRLAVLNLSKNRFGIDSSEALQQLIRDVPSLLNLNLSSNVLKNDVVIRLVEGLKINTFLQTLDLSDVGMEDDGALAIASALQIHPSLQRLYLGNNKITDIGGVSIGNALKSNSSLAVLSLKNNELKDDTAEAFLDALLTNTTIYDIDVSYNDFSYRIYVKLTQTVEEHRRTLSSNVEDVALRHVEWLKGEEKKLFEYRASVKQQEAAISDITATRDAKMEELDNLKTLVSEKLAEIQAELDDVRAKYESISDERRNQQADATAAKSALDMKQAIALNSYQSQMAKRQGVQTNRSKLNARRKEQVAKNGKDLEEMKKRILIEEDEKVGDVEGDGGGEKVRRKSKSGVAKTRRKSKVKRKVMAVEKKPEVEGGTVERKERPGTAVRKEGEGLQDGVLASDLIDGEKDRPIARVRPKTALGKRRELK